MEHTWKRPAAAGFVAALAIIAFSASATPDGASGAPEAVSVTMTVNRFVPGTIHVRQGGSVTWQNTSDIVHTVTGSGFDSGNVAAGESFTHTVAKPGTYSYYCTPHRGAGMVGTVVVDS